MNPHTALLLVGLLGANGVAASKSCRPPTTDSIAGAWVAVDDSFDYRLAVQHDGRGGFGIRDHQGTLYIYNFESIRFDDDHFSIQMEPMRSSGGPLSVKGRAPCSRPEFRFMF